MNLKAETLEKIDRLVPRYPTLRSAALPLCHLVQEDQGYLSKAAMEDRGSFGFAANQYY